MAATSLLFIFCHGADPEENNRQTHYGQIFYLDNGLAGYFLRPSRLFAPALPHATRINKNKRKMRIKKNKRVAD